MSYGRCINGNTEAGQGGKLGHSQMTHYDYTAMVKLGARKVRRRQDRTAIAEQLRDS